MSSQPDPVNAGPVAPVDPVEPVPPVGAMAPVEPPDSPAKPVANARSVILTCFALWVISTVSVACNGPAVLGDRRRREIGHRMPFRCGGGASETRKEDGEHAERGTTNGAAPLRLTAIVSTARSGPARETRGADADC